MYESEGAEGCIGIGTRLTVPLLHLARIRTVRQFPECTFHHVLLLLTDFSLPHHPFCFPYPMLKKEGMCQTQEKEMMLLTVDRSANR